MYPSDLWSRVQVRYRQTVARCFVRRSFEIRTDVPIISFTFDDFPRSALWTGGAILERVGIRGTYYASLGLMAKETETGSMFVRDDLDHLLKAGHELASHTFGHCHAWDTNPSLFEESIVQNESALRSLCPGASFRTFSYPIGVPRPQTKYRAEKHFVCCRGGGQTFNTGTADLNFLRAYFLDKGRSDLTQIRKLIDLNRSNRGWLIFATHDISDHPTRFGCTPGVFESVVRYSANSGARILPVFQSWRVLTESSRGPK